MSLCHWWLECSIVFLSLGLESCHWLKSLQLWAQYVLENLGTQGKQVIFWPCPKKINKYIKYNKISSLILLKTVCYFLGNTFNTTCDERISFVRNKTASRKWSQHSCKEYPHDNLFKLSSPSRNPDIKFGNSKLLFSKKMMDLIMDDTWSRPISISLVLKGQSVYGWGEIAFLFWEQLYGCIIGVCDWN